MLQTQLGIAYDDAIAKLPELERIAGLNPDNYEDIQNYGKEQFETAVATETGVRNVPPIYRRAALTMGSKRFHIWFKVILPAALPFIVSGMKQGWAFAWRSLMAAEIFVTILTGFGLGQLLHYGRELSAMEQVIGIMIVIVVIGLLADKIFFSPIERFLHRRWGTSQA